MNLTIEKQADALCEVVFDITTTVNAHLDKMDTNRRDRLMDSIEGTRGLFFQYVLPWAKEYQAAWDALPAEVREDSDYMTEIDIFADKKFAELARMYRVISIQVVPVIEVYEGGNSNITAQPSGPTHDTTQWSVYERDANGAVNWLADSFDEDTAMLLGQALAMKHGVPIEPQPWKEKK